MDVTSLSYSIELGGNRADSGWSLANIHRLGRPLDGVEDLKRTPICSSKHHPGLLTAGKRPVRAIDVIGYSRVQAF